MTFPLSRLGIRMRIAPGADLTAAPSTYAWIDVTTYVDMTFDIVDKIGSTDEATEANTELTFAFRNNDARFTTDNPESPYWPNWDIGCPIEYAKDNGDGGGFRDVIVTYLGKAEVSWTAGTEHRCIATVTAGGLFRRLGQDPALASALRRTILDYRRKAYYPLEDVTGATQAASALPNVAPLIPNNGGSAPEFGATAMVAGTASMANFKTGSRLFATLPSPTTTQGWRTSFLLHAATAPGGTPALFELYCTGGTVYRFGLELTTAGLRFRAWSPTNVELSGAAIIGFTDQYTYAVWTEVDIAQSGANIAWTVRTTKWVVTAAGLAGGSSASAGGTFVGTLGAVRSYALAPYQDVDDVLMAHWALTEQPLPIAGGFAAVLGWVGNTAAGRVVGMANEFDVPASVVDPAKGSVMGPQIVGSLLANLRDVQQTDHGILSDHTGVITYRTFEELYNLAPALLLSRARRGELPKDIAPVRDDTVKVNIASAARPGGGSFTATDAADVLRFGRYERQAINVNVAVDTVLPGHAGWALARGTDPGPRYQSLEIQVHLAGATTPGISTTILALALGDRIGLESLPPQAAKGGAEVQVRGRTQTVSGRTKWSVVYDLVPSAAYDAFLLDVDRLESSGTEVVLAATTTDTTLMVATAGTQIITGAGLSIPLNAAGEKVTMTAGADEPIVDPLTRVVANGWGSTPATAHLPAYAYSLNGSAGFAAADFAATGTAGTMSIGAALAFRTTRLAGLIAVNLDMSAHASVAVTPTGGPLELELEYRGSTLSNGYAFRVEITTGSLVKALFYNPSSVLIAEIITSITHTPGQVYRLRCAPINERHRCKVWVGATEPLDWTVDLVDASLLLPGYPRFRSGRGAGNSNPSPVVATWDNVQINNTQALTVTRSVNGVVKAIPLQSTVKLWTSRGPGIGV